MALSPKIFRFGVKAVIPYDRETKIPIGFSEVIASGGLDLTGEMITLQGGSNRYPYDTAHGFIEPKVSVTMKELPSWVYTLMLGVTPTVTDVSDKGKVENVQNEKGTSLFADGGKVFTGVVVKTDGDLKFGRYTVKLQAAGKIEVYAATDVDAGAGAKANRLTLFDDMLKIHDGQLDLADSTDIDLDNLGVTLEVGSTISDGVVGDTFSFDIIPKADYFREVTLGRNTDSFPAFGMYFVSENIQASSLCLIDCFKCKANGFPQTLSEKAWGESELTIMPVIDGANGLCKITDIVRN